GERRGSRKAVACGVRRRLSGVGRCLGRSNRSRLAQKAVRPCHGSRWIGAVHGVGRDRRLDRGEGRSSCLGVAGPRRRIHLARPMSAQFPIRRMRRLRRTAALRRLVAETHVVPSQLVWPQFVVHGEGVRRPIATLPGVAQLSVDQLVKDAERAASLGLGGVYLLGRTAVMQARAAADLVAPSDMLDGRVAGIRKALDAGGFSHVPIMSYAAKFASAFYGPFREAAGSTPQFGDRQTYQMAVANGDEAMKEIQLDLDEGADIVMVKPAGPCLDLIRRARDRFGAPLGAYQVSGEYAMIKAAAERGMLDESRAMWE